MYKKFFNKKNYDDFLNLIISGVKNVKCEFDNLDVSKMFKFGSFHSLDCLIYLSLKLNNFDISKEYSDLYQKNYIKVITQEAEKESIYQSLCDEKIKFLPLKGCVIRNYYLLIEMRQMADLDILVPIEELEHVGKVLNNLDYTTEHLGGNHDVYYKLPFMNIEIHRAMIAKTYATHDYYSDIWNKVKCGDDNYHYDNYHYSLDSNDFFIFNLIHMGKHFFNAGTGLRSLIDIYYFMNKNELDYNYIYNELDKVGLKTYSKKTIILVKKLFNYEDLDEDSMILLDFIVSSGTYGTILNNDANKMSGSEELSKAKKKYFLSRVFPSYKTMVERNPSLKKFPFLLPWFWFTRGIKGVLNFKKSKVLMSSIKNVDEERIERIKKVYEITGIKE